MKCTTTVSVSLGMVLFGLTACAPAADPPDGFLVSQGIDPPKLVRFVSRAPATDGKHCFGAVVREEDGIPQQVRVLPATATFDPCEEPAEPDAAAAQLRSALDVLDNLTPAASTEIEEIAAADLPERMLPPVRVEQTWLDQDEVFIVAAGLNYEDHKAETGVSDFVLFPKPIEPTGPYGPVASTPPESGAPVCLLDYEVEIAFVALKDIKLDELPSAENGAWGELASRLAFFAVNDVTDREPQILYHPTGFTMAKTRPGYLPSGPWLVAGWNLHRSDTDDPLEALTLELWTRDAAGKNQSWIGPQKAFSSDMIEGIPNILQQLSKLDPEGDDCNRGSNKVGELYCTMPDAAGRERRMVGEDILPAGSIVLTGTPGGTALAAPNRFANAFSSLPPARKFFLGKQKQKQARDDLNYLEPGDEVEQVISHLGRQTWSVALPDSSYSCS
jgi:2-keto-4-pentenoate hydratase/2-oxohepta-3-ene-1,7-dioic acid hydratase in catechol pathway